MVEKVTGIDALEPLEDQDIKVQYCDGSDCLHDCPPIGPGANCGSLLSTKE
ncbi:hypothetical protein [Clostridium sp. E02]|uniref:hypothetical protein n=1 Tax=Clostridium sp. E02 TaxID=2487134 RepID=UPI0013DE1751|nr:hypothetical protein [Clostridium sp. E02]